MIIEFAYAGNNTRKILLSNQSCDELLTNLSKTEKWNLYPFADATVHIK